jgi:hypothetical protein
MALICRVGWLRMPPHPLIKEEWVFLADFSLEFLEE